jgi:LmbE family N-acetylglucosaminyl deacetylase
MKDKKTHILVISPHPDDAEFGAAGSVAGFVRDGKSVVYVICTNGDKGTDDINVKPADLAMTREQEQLAAAKVLGVREVIFLRYPDQGLEDTPQFRKEIVRQIRVFKPDLIITADPYRRYFWHRDHRIVGRVVLDAIFPYARDVWAYPDMIDEGLMPHKVNEVWCWASEDEDINLRMDITDTYDLKVKALKCHKSQVSEPLSKEIEMWLCARAKELAEGEAFKLAEGFHRVEVWW